MYLILSGMARLVSPILAFTSDEIWQAMKHRGGEDARDVLYNDMPQPVDVDAGGDFVARWDKIHLLREDVEKALELARGAKVIGSPLDAKVLLHCSGDLYDFVRSVEGVLPAALIVSQVEIENGGRGDFAGEGLPGLTVSVFHADGDKCARCWSYSGTVGSDPEYPDVCGRCASVLKSILK